eukprot:scaffold2506_cov236-Pinguiococcus_pyrenoidosus.AAC.1
MSRFAAHLGHVKGYGVRFCEGSLDGLAEEDLAKLRKKLNAPKTGASKNSSTTEEPSRAERREQFSADHSSDSDSESIVEVPHRAKKRRKKGPMDSFANCWTADLQRRREDSVMMYVAAANAPLSTAENVHFRKMIGKQQDVGSTRVRR